MHLISKLLDLGLKPDLITDLAPSQRRGVVLWKETVWDSYLSLLRNLQSLFGADLDIEVKNEAIKLVEKFLCCGANVNAFLLYTHVTSLTKWHEDLAAWVLSIVESPLTRLEAFCHSCEISDVSILSRMKDRGAVSESYVGRIQANF